MSEINQLAQTAFNTAIIRGTTTINPILNMENELKFNSQVCTTKIQSQRLLDLGLKPETADMYIFDDEVYIGKPNVDDIPAWSLHRLMEIAIKGDKIFVVDVTNKNNIDYCYERSKHNNQRSEV